MRRAIYTTSFVALLLAAPAVADEGPMTYPFGRSHMSLNGNWPIIVDPYGTGAVDYRRRPRSDGFFRDAQSKSDADLIEYAFKNENTLRVPCDWNSQRPELLYYEGSVWYRQRFDLTRKPDRRYFLYFGAANYRADVYLNGEKLGSHISGFTPFEFDITKLATDGTNTLVVHVNSARDRNGVPTDQTDWWNYGGLTRDVLLIDTPLTFVRHYRIHLDPNDPRTIIGTIQLDGPKQAQPLQIAIPEAGIKHDVSTDQYGRAEFRIPAGNLKRWNPDDPKRYDVTIACNGDRVTEKIGFRTIKTARHQILLNDRPVFLRGICLHEEALGDGQRAVDRDQAEALLLLAKELNCNFVRLAHYPHNEWMVREADRLGMLVWSEIPVYWTVNFERAETLTNARTQLRDMIERDANRAAVIIWSVANETPRSDVRLKFLRQLIDDTRALDNTRLVSAALETHYDNPTTISIDDPLGEYLDVLGCNEYLGWYDGAPAKASTITWTTPFQKPLVISEFGAGAKLGHRGAKPKRWTEDYQGDVYRQQIAMLEKISFLAGTSPWILKDFRSPRRLLPEIQDGWNRKGLVSERGEKKIAFEILSEWYQQKDRENLSTAKVQNDPLHP